MVGWRYLEVAELPEDEVNGKMEQWLVARTLGWRVLADVAVREFRLHAGLKEEVVAFNLDQEFLLFCFQEAGERDAILTWPWVVSDQALVVEPWRPRFYPSPTSISLTLVWVRLPQLLVEL